MNEFFRRVWYLLNRSRYDRELENDMQFHREMAGRAERSNFGNALQLREDARQAWGWTWIDRLGQDLRYAARILWRAPGFTGTAVLILAAGIGVNVAVFGLFQLMALKPLPVPDPNSLVRLQRHSPEITAGEMPYPAVAFYREHAKTLRAVMASMGTPPMELNADIQPVSAEFVTANYFTELGTRTHFGRLFIPAREEAAGSAPVAVLSYGFWQRRFGGDPAVIGKVIRLNKRSATVIGVLPYAFASLNGVHADIWLPLLQQPYFVQASNVLTDPSSGRVRMWARLAPGATAKTAAQELLALTNERRKEYPKLVWDREYIQVDPVGHLLVMQSEMYQVTGMVGALVLLILTVACANLGGLLIARGVAREREISIRAAIGASRKRIFLHRELAAGPAWVGGGAGVGVRGAPNRAGQFGCAWLHERGPRLAGIPVRLRTGDSCGCSLWLRSGSAASAAASPKDPGAADSGWGSVGGELHAADCGRTARCVRFSMYCTPIRALGMSKCLESIQRSMRMATRLSRRKDT